jgi:hypothetical protein
MGTTVQARLDKKTLTEMNSFVSRKGWTTSKAVREAIKLLVRQDVAESSPTRIHGLGEFDFGVSDLSTNKKYMEGFGRSSMPGGKSRSKTARR